MYFLRNLIFHFPSVKKNIFGKKKCHLSSWYKKDHIPVQVFWIDHLFGTFEEYIILPCIFFWKRSSFIFRLKNNIISSGKRNIIFLDDTREIIFQCYFFGKTIFSEHLEKENMVFRAVWWLRFCDVDLLNFLSEQDEW